MYLVDPMSHDRVPAKSRFDEPPSCCT